MTKKILLLLPLLLISLTAIYSQTKPVQPSKTLQTPDSSFYYKGKTDQLTFDISKKESKWPIGSIIAIAAAAIALGGFIFNTLAFSREGAYKRVAFIAEVNKLQIANPDLRAMYNKEKANYIQNCIITGPFTITVTGEQQLSIQNAGKIKLEGAGEYILNNGDHNVLSGGTATYDQSGSVTLQIKGNIIVTIDAQSTLLLQTKRSIEIDARLHAYCYFLLNNFEIVFKKPWYINTQASAWQAYALQLMQNSSYFQEFVARVLDEDQTLYYPKYLDQLQCLLIKSKYAPPIKRQLAEITCDSLSLPV